MHKNIM